MPVQTPRKSVLAAVLLALLVPGLGHFYVGSNKRGIVFLCAILATSVTYAISSRNTGHAEYLVGVLHGVRSAGTA